MARPATPRALGITAILAVAAGLAFALLRGGGAPPAGAGSARAALAPEAPPPPGLPDLPPAPRAGSSAARPPGAPEAREAASATPTAPAARPVTVLGRVVAPGGGRLAGDVEMAWRGAASGPAGVAAIAPDGRFEGVVPARRSADLQIVVRARGFPPVRRELWREGEAVLDFDVIELPPPAVLRGRLRRPDGSALAGVTVAAVDAPAAAVVGPDGAFELPPVSGSERTTLAITTPRGQFRVEQPVIPGDAADMDLEVATAIVRGRVRMLGAGAPPPRSTLSVLIGMASGPLPYHGRMASAFADVGEDGGFVLEDLPPGPGQLLLVTVWRERTVGVTVPFVMPAEGEHALELRCPCAAVGGLAPPPEDAPETRVVSIAFMLDEDMAPADPGGFRISSFRLQWAQRQAPGRYLVGASAAGPGQLFALTDDGRASLPVPVSLEEGAVVEAPPLRFPPREATGRVRLRFGESGVFTAFAVLRDPEGRFRAAWTFTTGTTTPAIAVPAGAYGLTLALPGAPLQAHAVTVTAGETATVDAVYPPY